MVKEKYIITIFCLLGLAAALFTYHIIGHFTRSQRMAPKTVGMDRLVKENIFLLEFIVDRVVVELPGNKQDYKVLTCQTCVSFDFLDFGPFSITEDHFVPHTVKCSGCSGCGNMKSGTSCLFPMTPELLKTCLKEFMVNVEVYKQMQEYSVPDKFVVGTTQVPIMELFKQVITDLVTSNTSNAVSKTMKQCFRLHNTNDDESGQVSIYIRLSCFGKVIITKFKMNLVDETVEYRAKEGKSMYKYSKNEKNMNTVECPPSCSAKSAGKPCKGLGDIPSPPPPIVKKLDKKKKAK